MDNRRSIAVAIVDDDRLFLDYVGHNLGVGTGIRVLKMSSERELVEAVAQSRLDCIILDFDLGGDNGLVIAQRIKARFASPPPIIMLTGAGSERMAVKAFRSGFSDYVSKRNLNIGELLTAVRDAVAQWDIQEAARSDIARMKQQLTLDPTTGLFGAASMAAKLNQLTQENRAFTALLIDIIDLVEIRQKLGHTSADEVIHRFADRLKETATGGDLTGRYADDGFIYIGENLHEKAGIETLMTRLKQALTFSATIGTATVRLAPSIRAYGGQDDQDPHLDQVSTGQPSSASDRPKTHSASAVGAVPSQELSPSHDSALPSDVAAKPDTRIDPRDDLRGERRQRVLKRAKIVDDGLNISIDCTVRDMSSKGLRLRLDSYFAPPDRFQLMIVGSGTVQPVRLAWQVGDELGVEFLADGVSI